MDQTTITQEAIQAARREYLRRVHEANHDHDQDEELNIPPAVIARNVTIAQLRTVPIHWFDGVRIALLTDGSLVVTDVESAMARGAEDELGRQLDAYARANGLSVARRQPLRLRDGRVVTPSFVMRAPSRRGLHDHYDDVDEEPYEPRE